MSPFKQILLALVVGPLIAFFLIFSLGSSNQAYQSQHVPENQPKKKYIIGYIGGERVQLKIIEK